MANTNVTAKLATAFALGAAVSAAFLMRGPSSDTPANTDDSNLKREYPISGSALEPLSTEVLIKRSIEAFPAGYLLLIIIIQSVALGILLTNAVADVLKSPAAIETIAIVSKSITLFGFLVIISYEYLWFIGMTRYVSTFRDALIPYAIGVAEIIPCLILNQSLSWWIATTIVPIICAGALFNTITRLDRQAFSGKPDVYRTLRLLTLRTIACCGIIVAIGIASSVLLSLNMLHGIVFSLAPLVTILPALTIVSISEKSLNYFFEAYGISRKAALWIEQRRS